MDIINKLKIGVIGAGNMGKNHIRIYKELQEQCELIGFFDNNDKKSLQIEQIYDVKHYDKLDELLNKVDAVSIAVPTYLHYKYSKMCVSNKKHILLEKPITEKLEHAKELVDLCEKNRLVLQIGHVERFNPVVNELSNILKNEEIISLDFRRLSPYDKRIFDTDVIKDLMIHDIDIMNWIVDSEIKDISAHGSSIYSDNYIDYAQALLKFKNNILVSLTASRVTEDKVRCIDINTKNAFIHVDYLNKSITISRKTNYKLDTGYDILYKQENIVEKVQVQMKEPLKMEILSFLNTIMGKQANCVCGHDGLKALEIAEQICEKIY